MVKKISATGCKIIPNGIISKINLSPGQIICRRWLAGHGRPGVHFLPKSMNKWQTLPIKIDGDYSYLR